MLIEAGITTREVPPDLGTDYVANYIHFFQMARHRAAAEYSPRSAAETAWGEATILGSAKYDVVEDAGRSFRRKSRRASRQAPRGLGGHSSS